MDEQQFVDFLYKLEDARKYWYKFTIAALVDGTAHGDEPLLPIEVYRQSDGQWTKQ